MLSVIGHYTLLSSLLANPVKLHKLLPLGSASVPSDCTQNSLTAGSHASMLVRLRDDTGFACWGWRLSGFGLLSRKSWFISLASNLVQFATPLLCFQISDLLGVFFLFVVVLVVHFVVAQRIA